MRAEGLSRKPGCAGALALSLSGDPATGEIHRSQGNPQIWRRAEDLSAL
jgi:hypothetical protein